MKKVLLIAMSLGLAATGAFADAGILGTSVPSISTTEFGAVAVVVLAFAGVAFAAKKALALIK